MKRIIVACVATALVAGAATATADQVFTSKDLKDESIQNRDLRDGAFTWSKFRESTQNKIMRLAGQQNTAASQSPVAGPQGPKGDPGPRGATGPQGPAGADGTDATLPTAGNWGIVNRNTIGSPDQALRSGPATPPEGAGSLNLTVQGAPFVADSDDNGPLDPREKAAWGNETDFVNDPLSGIDEVGFAVYTTRENNERGNPNMPSIQFEVDPKVGTKNFSTLTFVPGNTAANAWESVDADAQTDTTGGRGWWFSGATGTETGCTQGSPCTFARIKTEAPDAVIGSVMVSKGRDLSWQGAIDALRINDQVFDFEEHGVEVTSP